MVTIPNNINPIYRRRLVDLGVDGFMELASRVERELAKLLDRRSQYQPVLVLVQRHYPSRRVSVVDGRLTFDLRTIRGDRQRRIKSQPFWIRSAFELFAEKQGANVQIQFGSHIPHASGYLSDQDALERVEAMWLGCRPLIECLQGRSA